MGKHHPEKIAARSNLVNFGSCHDSEGETDEDSEFSVSAYHSKSEIHVSEPKLKKLRVTGPCVTVVRLSSVEDSICRVDVLS